MGVKKAFNNGTFGQIITRLSLTVSKINHRATIDVTKDGTEAAAATLVEFSPHFGAEIILDKVVIDRPFIFFIHDKAQGAILFAGKCSNPEI